LSVLDTATRFRGRSCFVEGVGSGGQGAMIPQAEQYSFVAVDPALGAASLLPYLPIQLALGPRTVATMGLLDTAATVNVLPYQVGEQLSGVWDQQSFSVQSTGDIGGPEARLVVVC